MKASPATPTIPPRCRESKKSIKRRSPSGHGGALALKVGVPYYARARLGEYSGSLLRSQEGVKMGSGFDFLTFAVQKSKSQSLTPKLRPDPDHAFVGAL